MTRLFSDMDAANKRMLHDPVAFTDDIAVAIGKAERGAHRHKRKALALSVGIAREVRKSFQLFDKLREAECLRDNKKVQAATEKNFKELVPFAVAVRSFDNTEATPNRVSVYGYGIGYFVKKSIPVSEIADKIAAMKGIEGVYKQVKAKNRAEAGSNAFGDRDEQDAEDDNQHKQDDDWDEREDDWDEREDDEQDEATSPRSTPPKASAKPLTVKYITDNYLLVKMPTKKLDRYRNGPFSDDERRGLEIAYGGEGPHGLHEWAYVSKIELEDPDTPEEDNDNNVDDEEDAA